MSASHPGRCSPQGDRSTDARADLISESRRAYFDQLVERQLPHLERLIAADKRRPEMPSALLAIVEK